MNVVLVMSGGVGKRFGGAIPKQYHMIGGRPVIDYVIDAIAESKEVDHVVIAMDQQWINYSEKLHNPTFEFAQNGATRNGTMYNGLHVIKEKYACDKVVIVDAVRPFLTGRIIDDYFRLLDEYDAVITAQKITGGLTDIHDTNYNRDDFIVTQSPEGFRFPLLWNCFDIKFPYEEVAGMLPAGSKKYYNYEFKNNLKITYDFELYYAEFLLNKLGRLDRDEQKAFFDKEILYTAGLKNFFLRNRKEETVQWIDGIYNALPEIISKWNITSFIPSQISRYGLVLQATSQNYGEIILKFVPGFVGRFEREAEAFTLLPKSYMCEMVDVDYENRCLILKKIKPAKNACFEENLKLTVFFEHAVKDAVKYEDCKDQVKHIKFYYDELLEKYNTTDDLRFMKEEIEVELEYALDLYKREFEDAELYVLHCDLHELNILDDGERFYGIDPYGVVGPLEIECVKFVRNDVRNHPEFGYEHRFDLLIDSFSRFVDKKKLIEAFIIDMAFCTYNSVFENDDTLETEVDLELIRIARDRLSQFE